MAKQVFFLPREKSVTITPDAFASGSIYRQTQPGVQASFVQTFSASTAVTLGPYDVDYYIIAEIVNGEISKSIAFAGSGSDVTTELNRRANVTQAADVAASSDTTFTFDYLDGPLHKVTVSSNCTFAFSFPSDEVNSLLLNVVNGGASTITWPAGVLWAGGSAPTLTASGTDVIAFWADGSGNVYGNVVGLDMKAVA